MQTLLTQKTEKEKTMHDADTYKEKKKRICFRLLQGDDSVPPYVKENQKILIQSKKCKTKDQLSKGLYNLGLTILEARLKPISLLGNKYSIIHMYIA